MITLNERKAQSILIVDGSTSNLVLMSKILENQGYKVELADSDKSALLQITKTPPDLIVLNLMMPAVEGFEAKSCLPQDPRLVNIPILLLNANSCLKSGKMNDLGVNSVIHKPFEPDTLLLRINSLLKAKNAQEKNNHQQLLDNVTLFQERIIFLDLNQDDPLYQEQQELEAIQNNNSIAVFRQLLSIRGYEIVDCSLNN
ncbi:MAG: response regulator [Cyanobacteria bacterium P01_A01_bin.83]